MGGCGCMLGGRQGGQPAGSGPGRILGNIPDPIADPMPDPMQNPKMHFFKGGNAKNAKNLEVMGFEPMTSGSEPGMVNH